MRKPLTTILICILAVPTVAFLMGILSKPTQITLEWALTLKPYLALGAVLGVVNLLIRPMLHFLTVPIGCITMGLSGWAIDAGLVFAAGKLSGYPVPMSALYAVLTAIVINIVCAVVGTRD